MSFERVHLNEIGGRRKNKTIYWTTFSCESVQLFITGTKRWDIIRSIL